MNRKEFLVGKNDIRVAFVSTYPPRHCGVGTFTRALEQVMNTLYLDQPTKIVSVDDQVYRYGKAVSYRIRDTDPKSFTKAAHYLNRSPVEIVSLQHEYGLYGGEAGEHVLKFYQHIRKPVVTTLHSVLTKHSPKRAWVTQKILDASASVVVMTEIAKDMLLEIFTIDQDKIEVIPHGVPNIRPNQSAAAKRELKLEKRFLLSTFGLLNPGKGIEYALRALPEVVKQFPNVIYLVIGKTHPVHQRRFGEDYRRSLEDMVKQLNLGKHVQFVNRYLDYRSLVNYLKATDIYLMLQTDPNQAFSGTAAYALGIGSPIIGTPTPFNREILGDGRGVFVPFEDEYSVRRKLLQLIPDDERRKEMSMRSYRYARDMIWPRVALDYVQIFDLTLLNYMR
ncbi:glycosyltransferase family 4 protein [Candidatus Berkelbacteria bacterium]|nr:glycosyltransferase family 4 protein [Candidatus Berkelbacteria bacterium]